MLTFSFDMGSDSKRRAISIKDRARIGPSQQCTKEQPGFLILQNSLKLTQDLSKEIARYSSLVIGLGGSQDNQVLREELRLIRFKSYNLARQNIDNLTPYLRRRKESPDEQLEIEKLIRHFGTTLEFFLPPLIKTIWLLGEFSFSSPSRESKLINTGISEPLMGLKPSSASVSASSVTQLNEIEERKLLQRQVSELEHIIDEINQSIDHRPLEYPPIDNTGEDNLNDIHRNSRGESALSFFREASHCSSFTCWCLQRRRRQRWFQLVILAGIAMLVLFGCILGIYCGITVC